MKISKAYNKRALVEEAFKIAEKKHPGGFTKLDLIDCSKDAFGGYAVNQGKKLKTKKDIYDKGNYFSHIDGHYPAGMSSCYVVGLSGGCGYTCPVFMRGECETQAEMIEEMSMENYSDYLESDIVDLDEELSEQIKAKAKEKGYN